MVLTTSRWSAPVFRVGERTFTWLDVLLDAMEHGAWHLFDRHLRDGAGCAAEADRLGAWPDEAEVEAAATTFRYARDLLTPEETEAWLSGAGLELDAWSDVLTRDVLRARWADRLAEITAADLDVATLDARLVAAEGRCSGLFARFAQALATRVAVSETAGPALTQAHADRPAAPLLPAHAAWLVGLDAVDLDARRRSLATAAARAHAACQAALTPEALAAHLERYRLDWLRVDLERLDFSSADAAREATLCVRVDGLTLTEVAIESQLTVADDRALLDTLPAVLRDPVLSASPGDLVGPVEVNGSFSVVHIVSKAAGSLDDPLVRARAERSIIEALGASALLSQVVWIERP